MRKETQRQKILQHLKNHKSITPQDALKLYGCMRLATRIFELKADGIPIITTIEKGRDKDGNKCHYARYILTEEITK